MPWFGVWMWPSAGRRHCTLKASVAEVQSVDKFAWLYLGVFMTLAVPGSHRAGPYDPGGAPYGRREHGRFRRSAGRIPRCGKGVNTLFHTAGYVTQGY